MAEPVTAVVVRSYSACSSAGLVWQDLNADWPLYGSVPIRIDYDNPELCAGEITYEALQRSGAGTVILSDVAGGTQQFSASEVDAIRRYVREGHNLFGTYLLLYFEPEIGPPIDNRALAPLFGLKPQADYSLGALAEPVYRTAGGSALFNGIGERYETGGFVFSQTPADGTWSPVDKGSARYVALAKGRSSAILQFCAARHRAVYATHMPEFGGNAADKQFIYNVVSSGVEPGCGAWAR